MSPLCPSFSQSTAEEAGGPASDKGSASDGEGNPASPANCDDHCRSLSRVSRQAQVESTSTGRQVDRVSGLQTHLCGARSCSGTPRFATAAAHAGRRQDRPSEGTTGPATSLHAHLSEMSRDDGLCAAASARRRCQMSALCRHHPRTDEAYDSCTAFAASSDRTETGHAAEADAHRWGSARETDPTRFQATNPIASRARATTATAALKATAVSCRRRRCDRARPHRRCGDQVHARQG